jgi:RNA polymerase sigma-70 factor (ECF subfamily)
MRARDAAAWQDFVHIYGPIVYGWCRESGVSSSAATQVSERVFSDLAADLVHAFNSDSTVGVRGLLWGRTRSLLQGQNGVSRMPGSPPPDVPDVLQRLLQALRFSFEERSWNAYWKVVIDGKSPADVAAELGISSDAVRVAKARVLRRIREELATWTGQP